MKSCHNDHATTVVPNAKKIVHVFPVPVVITMAFVATNVLVATATMKRSLKKNGQPTSTTTSVAMSLQAERRKQRRIFLLDIS